MTTEALAQPTIMQLMSLAMSDIGAVKKADRNSSQNFNFRGIDAVINAVSPAFQKFGIVVTPTVIEHTYGSVEIGAKRTPMAHVTVKVTYTFYGPSGDWMASTVVGEAMDSGDKAMAKAMSVAFRTALLQSLALPTDDLDPDHDTYQRSDRAPQEDAKPKEKPTEAKFKEWVETMAQANDLATLNIVGVEANTFDLTDEQRNTLRGLFITHRDALAQRDPA